MVLVTEELGRCVNTADNERYVEINYNCIMNAIGTNLRMIIFSDFFYYYEQIGGHGVFRIWKGQYGTNKWHLCTNES